MGALPLAVDFVNANNDLLPGKTLEYYAVNIGTDAAVISSNTIKYIYEFFSDENRATNESTFFSEFICFRNMTDLMIKDDVIAFIGPDESCLYEALVASAWNLPIISYVSFQRLIYLIYVGFFLEKLEPFKGIRAKAHFFINIFVAKSLKIFTK